MATIKTSSKHLQIDKANSTMVLTVAIAAFIVAFSLVASRALLNKSSYQGRVIAAKEKASNQLKANVSAASSLTTAYKAFVSSDDNIIGGNPSGSGQKDGDNAKITLDALPSQYDFPALASSLELILTQNNYKIGSITGTDDELAQQNTQSPSPAPVTMPFTVDVDANLDSAKNLLDIFQKSIRPISIQTLDISGSNNDLKLNVTANTFYQPAMNLKIQTKVIK
ncbi:MAG: hypothetical protein ABI221_02775 [Candidatus Saccharimonadales bacterium]